MQTTRTYTRKTKQFSEERANQIVRSCTKEDATHVLLFMMKYAGSEEMVAMRFAYYNAFVAMCKANVDFPALSAARALMFIIMVDPCFVAYSLVKAFCENPTRRKVLFECGFLHHIFEIDDGRFLRTSLRVVLDFIAFDREGFFNSVEIDQTTLHATCMLAFGHTDEDARCAQLGEGIFREFCVHKREAFEDDVLVLQVVCLHVETETPMMGYALECLAALCKSPIICRRLFQLGFSDTVEEEAMISFSRTSIDILVQMCKSVPEYAMSRDAISCLMSNIHAPGPERLALLYELRLQILQKHPRESRVAMDAPGSRFWEHLTGDLAQSSQRLEQHFDKPEVVDDPNYLVFSRVCEVLCVLRKPISQLLQIILYRAMLTPHRRCLARAMQTSAELGLTVDNERVIGRLLDLLEPGDLRLFALRILKNASYQLFPLKCIARVATSPDACAAERVVACEIWKARCLVPNMMDMYVEDLLKYPPSVSGELDRQRDEFVKEGAPDFRLGGYYCHRNVLSARSSVFRAMFSWGGVPPATLHWDFSRESLEVVLEYVYGATLPARPTWDTLVAALKYDLRGLARWCETRVADIPKDVENLFVPYIWADRGMFFN